ncbi:MAG: ABC transporter ATP-binding protein [Deltaproteobacteria bacterium]|nr:ABC transporter ATP-binding protein [Deltaproteobacteria bacterium]
MPILEAKGIHKDFSGLEVLTGVDFQLAAGERFAIIGPNGAGKTTLFNILSGAFSPTRGNVLFKGEDISRKPPHLRNRLGMSRSFQITNVFKEISVFDNVLAGVRSREGLRCHYLRRPFKNRGLLERTDEILMQVGLENERDTPAHELAYGQQRALEMGITLSTAPDLILLDEPTAGMSRQETEDAVQMIRRVTESKACIIIEHDMNVVFSLADRISVLHYGVILACGLPEEIRNDQRVKDAYLGQDNQ